MVGGGGAWLGLPMMACIYLCAWMVIGCSHKLKRFKVGGIQLASMFTLVFLVFVINVEIIQTTLVVVILLLALVMFVTPFIFKIYMCRRHA